MELKDKVVVITGASSGIGKVLAVVLSQKGAKLSLLARREDRLNELGEKLGRAGSEAMAIPTDITRPEMVNNAIKKTIERFGRIDLLINNAGLGYFGPIEHMSMTDFDQVVKTNVYGLLHMTQAAIPYLKQSKGMIVNISSGLSKRALPFLSAYAGSKSMVDALSDGMRMELRRYGIRVLNYCPPETETEFHRNARHHAAMNMGTRQRKFAKTEDVVANIIKAIEMEKREVVEGKFLRTMNFFAPKLLDNMFYKAMVLKMSKD